MSEAEYLAAKWGIPVSIAIMAVAARMLLSADRWTLVGMVRGLLVGALVGTIAILYVWNSDTMSVGEKGAVIGISACLAEDIVMGLLVLGRKLREDPAAIIDLVINWRRKP